MEVEEEADRSKPPHLLALWIWLCPWAWLARLGVLDEELELELVLDEELVVEAAAVQEEEGGLLCPLLFKSQSGASSKVLLLTLALWAEYVARMSDIIALAAEWRIREGVEASMVELCLRLIQDMRCMLHIRGKKIWLVKLETSTLEAS
jgi:hypothetical protein